LCEVLCMVWLGGRKEGASLKLALAALLSLSPRASSLMGELLRPPRPREASLEWSPREASRERAREVLRDVLREALREVLREVLREAWLPRSSIMVTRWSSPNRVPVVTLLSSLSKLRCEASSPSPSPPPPPSWPWPWPWSRVGNGCRPRAGPVFCGAREISTNLEPCGEAGYLAAVAGVRGGGLALRLTLPVPCEAVLESIVTPVRYSWCARSSFRFTERS